MTSITPHLNSKIMGMSENDNIQVVIFVKPPEIDDHRREVPAFSDRSAKREQLSHAQQVSINRVLDQIQEISGKDFNPANVRRQDLLGTVTVTVPVFVLRQVARNPLVEKVVEDVNLSLKGTNLPSPRFKTGSGIGE